MVSLSTFELEISVNEIKPLLMDQGGPVYFAMLSELSDTPSLLPTISQLHIVTRETVKENYESIHASESLND
jgi:hypothetical protein